MTDNVAQRQIADYPAERAALAAAFRWAARYGWHEATANHFSLAVAGAGARFLVNPPKHFSRIRASDLLLLDADDPSGADGPGAPDPTAWGLHGALRRTCPQARCALHAHPKYATVLAGLADSRPPPIDQNSAAFFNRVIVDDGYTGMAFEDEGARIARLFQNSPQARVMIMGNHGVLVIGDSVAEAFDRFYYFERAAETVVTAYMTGQPLRRMPDAVAEKTAQDWERYPTDAAALHFAELRAILDAEGSDYAA